MKKGVRSASAYLYGLLFLVSALVFVFVGYLSFESKHPSVGQAQVQAAVAGPYTGSNLIDYYVVTATNPAEDSGDEVCAALGKTCVGYTLFDESVCTQVHPTATVDNASTDGSKAGYYCDGAPQVGAACGSSANSCKVCPSCNIGVSCSESIATLYREMYVQCVNSSTFVPQSPALINDFAVNDVTWTSLVHNNVLYVAGDFNVIGPPQGYFTILDSTTGASHDVATIADADDVVSRVISDGSGGWYISGSFDRVGDAPHIAIAHILSDGTVDPNFNPVMSSATVMVLDGSTLYLGGSFTSVNNITRNRLAAVNATTGALTAWNPNVTGGVVSAMVIDGGTVYVGGSFTTSNTIGGAARSRIAAINKTTGLATAWNPNAGNTVSALDVDGSYVYAGGSFTTIGGQTRNRIARLDKTTGLAEAWNPASTGGVSEIDVIGTDVWVRVAGTVTIGGASRLGMAKLSTGSNTADAWNALISGGNVNDFFVDGGFVYLGGRFTSVGGSPRLFTAKVSATTAALEAYNPPDLGGSLSTTEIQGIAVQGTDVLVTGNWTVVGGVARQSLAAFDSSMNLLPWNPFDGYPVALLGDIGLFTSLVANGNTMYVGGAFYWENPLNAADWRDGALAIDIPSETVLAWNPAPNDFVWGMDNDGSTIYFGGDFTTIGGQTRNSVAAIDGSTGLATAWNPNITNPADDFGRRVWDIHFDSINNLVFAGGGDFSHVAGSTTAGGQPVLNLVAIDKSTGVAVQGFNANNDTFGFVTRGNNTVALGFFSTVAGLPRLGYAEMAGTTLTSTTFDLESSADKGFYDDGNLFISGSFNSVDGITHNGGVMISPTGFVDQWDPGLIGVSFLEAYTVAKLGNFVVLGGDFYSSISSTRFLSGLAFYSGGGTSAPDPEPDGANIPTRLLPDNNAARAGIVTLSAQFSSDTLTGQTEYRVSSASAPACLAGTSIVFNQTSATTATINEPTSVVAAGLGNGTYYWCARNRVSGFDTAWTTMGTFVQNNAVPYMNYMTYVGSTTTDFIGSVWFSGSDIYFTATASAADFPTTIGALDTSFSGTSDIAIGILQMNGGGSADLQYMTFLGGSLTDDVTSIETSLVLSGGKIYVLGRTSSTDFPVTGGAYDTVHNGSTDVVAARLNGTATAIEYATFLGSTGAESPIDLEVDSGIMYIGSAVPTAFPTTAGAYDTSHNGSTDLSLVKLNPAGGGATDLVYSTFVGTAGAETDTTIEIVAGKFYFSGRTITNTFPTTGTPYDSTFNGGRDIVIGILNPGAAGAADLQYSTFIGGLDNDDVSSMDYDPIGSKVYITGQSSSTDFPTTVGAYQTTSLGDDSVIIRFDPTVTGTAGLEYSTYFGGSMGIELAEKIIYDSGDVYIVGTTKASNFPVTSATAYGNSNVAGTAASNEDIYFSRLSLDAAGSADLVYATVFGLDGFENDVNGLAINGSLAYLGGVTFGTMETLSDPGTPYDITVQANNSFISEGYLMRVDLAGATPPTNSAPTAPSALFVDDTNAQSGSANPTGITNSTPVFSALCNDPNAGDILNKYRIQVDNNNDFSSIVWDSGSGGTAMTNCVAGARSSDIAFGGTPLAQDGTTYYWRIKFWDDEPTEGVFSQDPVSTNTFTMNLPGNTAPTAPTTLYSNNSDASAGTTNPTGITSSTPVFSALCNDSDVGDILNKYRIQVDNNNDFSSILWDSGAPGTSMTNCTAGARSQNITYGGAALTQDGSTYYWRIKFWDDEPSEGVFSESPTSTNSFVMATAGGGGGGGSSIQRLQQIQTIDAPTIGPVSVLSSDSIRYEWTYTGDTGNLTGFRLINDEDQVAVQVESSTAVAATETGLPHNSVISGRKVTAYNTDGESLPSDTYADEYTHMLLVTPSLISRIGDEIFVEVDQDLNNLQVALSGVQFELIPATAEVGVNTITGDWVQTPIYTFKSTQEGTAYLLRVRARNQIGFETVWSSTVLIPGEESVPGVAALSVGLNLTASDGQSITEPLNPHSILYGEVTVNNTGTADADNVLMTLPIPDYISYIHGTMSVDGRNQSDSVDGDFGQSGNGVLSVIWSNVPFGFGHTIRFQLGFDTQRLIRELESTQTTDARVIASVNPEIVLQAQASHEDDLEPVFSNQLAIEPDLAVLEALVNIEPEPVEEEPTIPIELVIVPTPEQVEIIENILQEEFPQPGQPAPAQPIPQGETTSSRTGGSFMLSTTSGDNRLTMNGSARTDDDQIQFTGTTSEPFTVITLIFNNSITAIVVSDAFGNWQTFVSADQLGISEGEEAQVTIEAIAAKGDLRSERVQIAEVTIARGMRGDIVADFETIVSDQGVVRTLQNAAETVAEALEENEPEIQATLVVSAPVIVASSVPLWGYIPYIPSLIYHFIGWLFGFLGRKKKDEDHPTWGVVYDAITKLPLPLAIVRIYNQADNKLASTIVTDKLGRYDALLAPGQYSIEVAKPQYQFPSSIVTTSGDGAFDRVYQANSATTIAEGSSVLPHVPVDPINVKRQWELSFGFRKAWLAFQRVGNHLATPIMVVGLVVAMALTSINPDRLGNWLMMGLYLITLASQLKLKPKFIKAWGVVYDIASNAILPLVTIQLIEPATSKVVTSRLSDYEGRFTFLPEPGSYVVKASKPGFTQVTEVVQSPFTDRQPLPQTIDIKKPSERVSGDVPMKQV